MIYWYTVHNDILKYYNMYSINLHNLASYNVCNMSKSKLFFTQHHDT